MDEKQVNNTMNIHDLIKQQVQLDAEIKCHSRLEGMDLSPGIRTALVKHQHECVSKFNWIDKVFRDTTIEVPRDQAL